jgi:hypothetical protein
VTGPAPAPPGPKRSPDAWRRLRRSGPGRRLLRARPMTVADDVRRYVATARAQRRDPQAFTATRTLLVFVGHVKSGGSLLGALLDAHPDAAIADEADVLRYLSAHFGRDQLLHLLVRGSRTEAGKGRVTARRLEPYSLAVPGQWQGRTREPLVVGDSRAGPTTRRAGDDPGLLDRLEQLMAPIEVRYVHVVRHPLDPISAMVLRSGRHPDDAIADHAAQCRRLERLRRHIPPERLRTVRYEAFVADPRPVLAELCRYLGLDADAGHLDAACALVRADRAPERTRVSWQPAQLAQVSDTIARFDFLAGYQVDDPHGHHRAAPTALDCGGGDGR